MISINVNATAPVTGNVDGVFYGTGVLFTSVPGASCLLTYTRSCLEAQGRRAGDRWQESEELPIGSCAARTTAGPRSGTDV